MEDADVREARLKWLRVVDRMERAAQERAHRLDQAIHRMDLRLGYVMHCIRQFACKSQADLARMIGVTQSSLSKWERGERLPSLSTLAMAADAAGLELLFGLRDPDAREAADEFVLLATYRGEGPMVELEIFLDKFANRYVPARPWRAEIEAKLARPPGGRPSRG